MCESSVQHGLQVEQMRHVRDGILGLRWGQRRAQSLVRIDPLSMDTPSRRCSRACRL